MIRSVSEEDRETQNKEIVLNEHEFKLFSDGFLDGEIDLDEINEDSHFFDDDVFFDDERMNHPSMYDENTTREDDSSSGSLTVTTQDDMKNRLKIKIRRRYKNFTSIPKVPKCDIRRDYSIMFANVTNMNDIRVTEGFFKTFAVRHMVFTLHDLSQKIPRNMEMKGLPTVLQFWFDRYAMDTDGVMKVNNAQVYFYADSKESKVTWNFTFKSTCLYDIPYSTEYQAHEHTVVANGSNDNVQFDAQSENDDNNSEVSDVTDSSDKTSTPKSTTKNTGKRKIINASQYNILASKCPLAIMSNSYHNYVSGRNSIKNNIETGTETGVKTDKNNKSNKSSVQAHSSPVAPYDTMVEEVMQKAPLLSQPMEMLVTGMTTMYLNSNKEITKQDTTLFSAKTQPIEKCF